MERMEELASLVSEPLQQRFLTDLDQIMLSVKDNIQLLGEDLFNALQAAIDEAACLQTVAKKGAIAYISFSLLQSNLLLEKYELFSNVPIPDTIKAWLIKKGIPFTEILD